MSVNATKIARMGFAGAVLATGLSATLLTGTSASASTSACQELRDIYMYEGAIYGEHFRYCDPVETPLAAAIERRVSSTSWVTVASGSGVAYYPCGGTVTHTYRLKGTTSPQITVPCS